MARFCSVDGCDVWVSESQDFCARCWNNVPTSERYMVEACRDQLNDVRVRLQAAVVRARVLAAQELNGVVG